MQNAYNLVDRTSQPVLDACIEHGIAFVPFFPLGSASPPTIRCSATALFSAAAAEQGRTPAQIALAWTLSVAPNVLLIPGTSSVSTSRRTSPSPTSSCDDDTSRKLDAARLVAISAR